MTTLPPQDQDQEPDESGAPGADEAEEPGGWLRQQRRARGWTKAEMARRLREAAKAVDDELPKQGTLASMIRRWERGFGVSERYRLHYCRAFRIPAEHYGTAPVDPGRQWSEPAADSRTAGTLLPAMPVPPARSVAASPVVLADGRITEPGQSGSQI